jgi:hypothetical protein
MNCYDYSRYAKSSRSGTTTISRFGVFDRRRGVTNKIATVYDVADAELICAALNSALQTPKGTHNDQH